jgi:hypothetical protein
MLHNVIGVGKEEPGQFSLVLQLGAFKSMTESTISFRLLFPKIAVFVLWDFAG